MNNNEFYDVIDNEIQQIVNVNKDNPELQKKNLEGKKSYCFLLWFLINNLHRSIEEIDYYRQYIVDGNDDNSCDLIFSNKEKGEEIYYIVQAKWFSKGKINNSNDISNIYKACLTDFNMMLEHKKEESKTNLKFNKMYKKLKKHVENNGKVRFLLVTLCVTTPDFRLKELDEYCASPLVKTEIYDLISIKNTYIDNNYRGYITNNPLQAIDTVNQDININIKKGHLQVNDSTYIFLLGAEEINRLYKMFGHRLFLKNVRNPLSVAANKAIEQSAKTDPDHFLGYNNGITVITKKVNPFFPQNTKITISGLQVINGAQTFKSIADAYESATKNQKKSMREKLAIVMKTIAVDNTIVEHNIIQYTNTQTSIIPRDYRSNDPIQEFIYFELLRNTDIIYERKRGEFSDNAKKTLNVVSNENMAQCYLAYGLQNPHLAKTGKKQLFDSENGVYESIFKASLDYRLFYSSYIVFQYVSKTVDEMRRNDQKGKEYKLLKDGKYYIVALIRKTYVDSDPYFNEKYDEAIKKKSVEKEAMAVSMQYQLLTNQNPENVLAVSFDKAVEIIVEYIEWKKIEDTNNIYKRADLYQNLLEYYSNRKQHGEIQ